MPTHYECAVMCQKSTELTALPGWEKLFFTGDLDVPEPAYFHPATAYINNKTKELCIAFHESKLIEEISTFKKEYGIKFDWQKQLADRLEHFFKYLSETLKSAAILINHINFRVQLLNTRKMSTTSTSKAKLKPLIEILNQIESILPSQFKAEEINQFLELINPIIKNFKPLQTANYKSTYTGFSTGAVIAGLFASRDKVKAVLFESPGYKELIESDHRFQNYKEEDTTCYLTAPNQLNTFRLHIGNPYRLYIPHIAAANPYSYTNSICSTSASMQRFSQKLAIIIFVGNILFYGGTKSRLPLISDFRFIFFLTLLNAVIAAYKSLTVEKRASLDSYSWFLNQHSINKLLSCFDQGSGQPIHSSLMQTWPSAKDLEKHWENRDPGGYEELFKFFSSYRKGIATIFKINEVIEEKIKRINNYQILQEVVINPKNNDFFDFSLR